jgi:hypothetical protein|tara:strand:+ start:529 stop:810 length:282 start_codon:yes stop_codon:yes gene_type:complete
MSTMEQLDNPAWHSMITRHGDLATVTKAAGNYRDSVSPFSALKVPGGDPSPLAEVIGKGKAAVLAAPYGVHSPVNDDFEELAQIVAFQMICPE